MLKLVYENVPTLQEEYEAYIRGSCDEEMEAMLVHLGRGPFPRTLYWFNNLGMWVSFHRAQGRFWNAYGFNKPQVQKPVVIDFEINYSYDGLNPTMGGGLARDSEGTVYFVHRGKSAARKGLAKEYALNFFDQCFRDRVVTVLDDKDRHAKFILVARMLDGFSDIADLGRAVVALKQGLGRRM